MGKKSSKKIIILHVKEKNMKKKSNKKIGKKLQTITKETKVTK